jgi:hypothetical protein
MADICGNVMDMTTIPVTQWGIMLSWKDVHGDFHHHTITIDLPMVFTRTTAYMWGEKQFGESLTSMREISPSSTAWMTKSSFVREGGAA